VEKRFARFARGMFFAFTKLAWQNGLRKAATLRFFQKKSYFLTICNIFFTVLAYTICLDGLSIPPYSSVKSSKWQLFPKGKGANW
jgi:hypothetical protein